MNNLLVTGSGSIRLIDHGHCFSGPSWTKRDLKADAEHRNKLSNWLTPQLTEAERKGAMADVTNLVGKIVSTDVEAAMREAMAQQYYGEDDADALIGFLESRGALVSAMSAKALGTLL